jgi:hypothetical protein
VGKTSGIDSAGRTAPSASVGPFALVALVAYLLLAVATGLIWERQNDEGVTYSVAIGELELDDSPAAPPLPVADVYDMLDGQATFTADSVFTALRNPDQMTHPPGFYLAVHGWASLVGTGPLAVRAPAYVLGLLSVLGLGLLARRLVGAGGAARAGGAHDASGVGEHNGAANAGTSADAGRALGAGGALALVMTLLAVSPWFLGVSNFLRPYPAVLCFGIWTTLAVASARPSPLLSAWRIGFVVLSAAGLYVVYHYAFVVLWHGVALLLIALRSEPSQRKGELLRLAGMTAGVALLFAPWVPTMLEHMRVTEEGTYFWKNPEAYAEPFARAARTLQRFALGEVWDGWGEPIFKAVLAPLAAVTAALAVLSFRRAGREGMSRAAGIVWLTAPIYPALIVWGDLARGAGTAFITKYVFLALPILLVLVARAWAWAPWRGLARLGAGAWVLLLLAATVTDLAMRAELPSDHEAVAEGAAATDGEDQLVVLSSSVSAFAVPLVLTLRDAGVERSRLVAAPGDVLIERLAGALADPSLRRLVLVRFDGSTPRNPYVTTHAYVETWTPELLEEVEAAAAAAGWIVARGHPRTEPGIWAAGGRVLVLADGARTKRFHGNY